MVAPVSTSRSVPFMADPVDEAVDSDSPDRESAARGRFGQELGQGEEEEEKTAGSIQNALKKGLKT